MAWVKVDDRFPEHGKVMEAARHLGRYGAGRVLAVWVMGMCYCNRNETNGEIPVIALRSWKHVDRDPFVVAAVMALAMPSGKSGLFEAHTDRSQPFVFHDYADYQPTVAELELKRAKDRHRKQFPHGFQTDSARIPRAPSPNPKIRTEDHRRTRAGRLSEASRFNKKALLKMAHMVLDDGVADIELKAELKDRAARAGLSWPDAATLNTVLDEAQATREKRRKEA